MMRCEVRALWHLRLCWMKKAFIQKKSSDYEEIMSRNSALHDLFARYTVAVQSLLQKLIDLEEQERTACNYHRKANEKDLFDELILRGSSSLLIQNWHVFPLQANFYVVLHARLHPRFHMRLHLRSTWDTTHAIAPERTWFNCKWVSVDRERVNRRRLSLQLLNWKWRNLKGEQRLKTIEHELEKQRLQFEMESQLLNVHVEIEKLNKHRSSCQ